MSKNIPKKKEDIEKSGLKHTEVNFPFVHKTYRRLGCMIAKKLLNTKISVNQVSFFSFFMIVLSAYFFFRADYTSIIIAAILLQIGYFFDFVDGSLARMRNSASAYGEWFDQLGGTYGYALLYISVTLGVYSRTHNPYILFFGLLGAVGTIIKNLTQRSFLNSFDFASKFGGDMYKRLGFLMFFRPTAPFIVTIFTFGAIFNKLYFVLIFLGIYAPLYSVIQNVFFTLKIKKEFLKRKKV